MKSTEVTLASLLICLPAHPQAPMPLVWSYQSLLFQQKVSLFLFFSILILQILKPGIEQSGKEELWGALELLQ